MNGMARLPESLSLLLAAAFLAAQHVPAPSKATRVKAARSAQQESRTPNAGGGSKFEAAIAMSPTYQQAMKVLGVLEESSGKEPIDLAELRTRLDELRAGIAPLMRPGVTTPTHESATGPAHGPYRPAGGPISAEELEARARLMRRTHLPTGGPVPSRSSAIAAGWVAARSQSAARLIVEMRTLLDDVQPPGRTFDRKSFGTLLASLRVILERAAAPPRVENP